MRDFSTTSWKHPKRSGTHPSRRPPKVIIPIEIQGEMQDGSITITFGDVAENHVGMEKIGSLATEGFTAEELASMSEEFASNDGISCELVDLKQQGLMSYDVPMSDVDDACVLVIRNGIHLLCPDMSADKVFSTLRSLEWDKKAKMYGKVVHKRARYNLCFADQASNSSFEEGKGTVIAFETLPALQAMRRNIGNIFGDKATQLVAEGNFYYDVSKCGIGFHGDAERKIVIAIRLGSENPLVYHWFHKNQKVGEPIEIPLKSGDVYVMSEKATGFDWKKKNRFTLRHAAGCSKYVVPKQKASHHQRKE